MAKSPESIRLITRWCAVCKKKTQQEKYGGRYICTECLCDSANDYA
jgi:hypothetical protein